MADCTGVFLLGKSSNMNSCKICLGRSRETKIAWWNMGRKEQKTSVCIVGGGVHVAAYTFRANHQERVTTGKVLRTDEVPEVRSVCKMRRQLWKDSPSLLGRGF